MKLSTIIVIFVGILIIATGAWWYMSQNSDTTQTPQTATTVNVNNETNTTSTGTQTGTTTSGGIDVGVTAGVNTAKTVTVNYSAAGFSPATVTINKGDTVKFVSTDGSSMWVGADEHPSHTEYDGTSRGTHCAAGYAGEKSFDQCAAGSTYSFTFTKTGSFGYHNHVAAQKSGTVIVQ
jgi:plastocyanin